MVPQHLCLGASASLKQVADGLAQKKHEKRKSFVEFSNIQISTLERELIAIDENKKEQLAQRERQRQHVLQLKGLRASATEYKAGERKVDEEVAKATSSLLTAELRHNGRGKVVGVVGRGAHSKSSTADQTLGAQEIALEREIEAAAAALEAARSRAHAPPVSPPTEPADRICWTGRLKERPRGTKDVSISREVLRRGTNRSTRGPSGGRDGAPADRPPYVEPGLFTSDWSVSKQMSQGQEDISQMREDDWSVAMDGTIPNIVSPFDFPLIPLKSDGSVSNMPVVREWELVGLASLADEDKAEHGRCNQSKITQQKIGDPNWRPWRESVPRGKTRRGKKKQVSLQPDSQVETAVVAVLAKPVEPELESEPEFF
jgi:hypothetical protein